MQNDERWEFRPEIDNHSRQLAARRRDGAAPVYEALLQEHEATKARLAREAEATLAKKYEECTFAPSLKESAAVSNQVLQRGGRSPLRRAFCSTTARGSLLLLLLLLVPACSLAPCMFSSLSDPSHNLTPLPTLFSSI